MTYSRVHIFASAWSGPLHFDIPRSDPAYYIHIVANPE